jgi:hypothetical protein
VVTRRLLRYPPPGTTDAEANARRDQLSAVDRLVDQGKLTEAVDLLASINRSASDPATQIALVDLRARAAADYTAGSGRSPWPPVYADPFPDTVGEIPEIAAVELTADILGGAVAHHGCLIVRGVFSEAQVARTVDVIEHTHRRRDQTEVPHTEESGRALADEAWYRPLSTDSPDRDATLRAFVGRQGGTWLADSPRCTTQILDDLDESGVIRAISAHLGERLFFSLQKSTLRRSLPVNSIVAWHQDGSFLDPFVRTMNVWIALSACGGDQPTPGMEVVPKRMPAILPVDGVMSPHSISYDLVAEIMTDTPSVVPEFAPGDSMMFDEHFLHRTHLSNGMTRLRYALECWFFAPSHPSPDYTPLLV